MTIKRSNVNPQPAEHSDAEPMAVEQAFLDATGVNTLWTKAKGTFAPIESPAFLTSITMGKKSGTNTNVTACTASGQNSVAVGSGTRAYDLGSFAEGVTTTAGATSHGSNNASYRGAHAEGISTFSTGNGSHAEGSLGNASADYSHAEGYDTKAQGLAAHAEGYTTTASGAYTHAEGNSSKATSTHAHAEGFNTTASGVASHAENSTNTAKGANSHAEGSNTQANGITSHTEGTSTIADTNYTHAEGHATKVYMLASHAEGSQSIAGTSGNGSDTTLVGAHAEGEQGSALGAASHVEGYKCTTYGKAAHAEGYNTTAGDSSIAAGNVNYGGPHAEGMETLAYGQAAHAEGRGTKAYGGYSHAEGYNTIAGVLAQVGMVTSAHAEGGETQAISVNAHAEGSKTVASGLASHAEGSETTASGECSHAEGVSTEASGTDSHAEGKNAKAVGNYSHAGGYGTSANGTYGFAHGNGAYTTKASAVAMGTATGAEGTYQVALGRYNVTSTASTDLFILGKGTSSTRSNAFRITSTASYGGTHNTSGADYAEMFEWKDGNPGDEDRVGRFVTLEGEKIRLAQPEDDFILGIVSGNPSVLGDVYDDQWKGMYMHDIFGRPLYEYVTLPPETAEEPDPEDPTRTIIVEISPAEENFKQQVINPDYNPDELYIPRSERPEWDAVGMLGKLVMIDDGTCLVDGYCKPGKDGVATRSDTKTRFRVMSQIDANHIRVLILPQ